MDVENDNRKKSSGLGDKIGIVIGSICLLIFLVLLFTGDFASLFDVTPGGRRLNGIPVFMILLLAIVAFIFPFGSKKNSAKKNTEDDH
jgi:hypothetical protein